MPVWSICARPAQLGVPLGQAGRRRFGERNAEHGIGVCHALAGQGSLLPFGLHALIGVPIAGLLAQQGCVEWHSAAGVPSAGGAVVEGQHQQQRSGKHCFASTLEGNLLQSVVDRRLFAACWCAAPPPGRVPRAAARRRQQCRRRAGPNRAAPQARQQSPHACSTTASVTTACWDLGLQVQYGGEAGSVRRVPPGSSPVQRDARLPGVLRSGTHAA